MSNMTIKKIKIEMSQKFLEKFLKEQEEDGFSVGWTDAELKKEIEKTLEAQFPKFPKEKIDKEDTFISLGFEEGQTDITFNIDVPNFKPPPITEDDNDGKARGIYMGDEKKAKMSEY